MTCDPSAFHAVNVADTCAIWNVLSSRLLYATARAAGCNFCCTTFVLYECLHKPRANPTAEDTELQSRLKAERQAGAFGAFSLDLEDLGDIAALHDRRRLSKGELSSIAFARKIRHAFLTDDQGARRLACDVLDRSAVQTTPHLFGWLYFKGFLGDGDKDEIIREHSHFNRPLSPYFEDMYVEALRCRSLAGQSK
ncbi:MAG: hypothetical protein ACYC3S_15425 [Chloroflexota bacterium]